MGWNVSRWAAFYLLAWSVACATGGSGSGSDDDSNASSSAGGSGPTTGAVGPGATGSQTSSGVQASSGVASGGSAASSSSGSGGGCSETPCKVTTLQCGCASGEKCTLGGQGMRVCTADGNVPFGGNCSGQECVAGSMCLGDLSFANCKKFCDADSECSSPGGLCIIEVSDGMGGSYKERWCSDNCDPVTGTGCQGLGGKCEIGQEQMAPMRFFTNCLAAGSATQGQACLGTADCASGYSCINYNMTNTCAKWCTVASPSCPGGATCASFNTPLLIGSVEYGACI